MNILLADPDRDFLGAYSRLLGMNGYEITTVFDGTQIVTRLTEQNPSLVILSEDIPRISCQEILRLLNDNNITSIVISNRKISSGLLAQKCLANAYIALPFLPDELISLIDSVQSKRKSKAKLKYDDIVIDVGSFTIGDRLKVTDKEIDIFEALTGSKEFNRKKAIPYINALNTKLRKLKSNVRIKYIISEGYRLVRINNE